MRDHLRCEQHPESPTPTSGIHQGVDATGRVSILGRDQRWATGNHDRCKRMDADRKEKCGRGEALHGLQQ